MRPKDLPNWDKFQKCYKIDSGSYAEVFEKFVRIKGTNYNSLEELDSAIKGIEDDIEIYKRVKEVWIKKFKSKEKHEK